MSKIVWCMLVLMVVGVVTALAPSPAEAAGYPEVAGLAQWSAETSYMSHAGYLRWLTFKDQGVWLSMAEAKRIVAEQLAG